MTKIFIEKEAVTRFDPNYKPSSIVEGEYIFKVKDVRITSTSGNTKRPACVLLSCVVVDRENIGSGDEYELIEREGFTAPLSLGIFAIENSKSLNYNEVYRFIHMVATKEIITYFMKDNDLSFLIGSIFSGIVRSYVSKDGRIGFSISPKSYREEKIYNDMFYANKKLAMIPPEIYNNMVNGNVNSYQLNAKNHNPQNINHPQQNTYVQDGQFANNPYSNSFTSNQEQNEYDILNTDDMDDDIPFGNSN